MKALIPLTIEGQAVERRHHEGQELYSVVDVIAGLGVTDSAAYWRKMKHRDQAESKKDGTLGQLVPICHGLKRKAPDGKMRVSDYANRESIIFIIEKIPSPKADPWRKFFAAIVEERLQEEADPEKAIHRGMNALRRRMPPDAIEARLRGIASRNFFCAEIGKRGIAGRDFGRVTNLMGRALFGMDTHEHRTFKGLSERDNLRDHMGRVELSAQALAEEMALEKAQIENSLGFREISEVGISAGRAVANAVQSVMGNALADPRNNLPPRTMPMFGAL